MISLGKCEEKDKKEEEEEEEEWCALENSIYWNTLMKKKKI